uniref:Uncharacterized protein n=1 Tax=Avena sativa TaxID=4498 RepID=A0ACD5VDP5_AVESA
MESESDRKKCARAIGGGASSEEDRLSGLPDDVLHSILGVLPLKHVVRTSALSTRWAPIWLHALAASAVLDFTDRDFVRGQSPAQITAIVGRVLGIHGAAPIDVLRVALSPLNALGPDPDVVVGWIAAALGRGAREVGVDLGRRRVLDEGDGRASLLQLPADLFQVENSLSVLGLGGCSLRHVLPGAAGLAGLASLSLDRVDVTDDALRGVVLECRLLEYVSLRSCHLLVSVRVAGERLRGLEIVGCLAMRDLQVAAPTLESVAFHGDILCSRDYDDVTEPVVFIGKGNTRMPSDAATPELRDAYLSHLGFGGYDELIHEFAYSCFLETVAHARILTLCSVGLLHIEETRMFYELTMDTPNLEEVQLLMDSMGDDDVTRFAGFFGLTEPPLLQRLFVRLPAARDDSHDAVEDAGRGTAATGKDADIVLDYEIALDHLTFIKVVNFHGTTRELRLLRFLLRRAPVMERLVLVTPEEEGAPGDYDLQQNVSLLIKIVQEHVSEIRNAWLWQDAHVTVCRPREDESRRPVHTKYYHDDQALT